MTITHTTGEARPQCFYCRLYIDGVYIRWFGANGTIDLHPACAAELSKSLRASYLKIRSQASIPNR